jgi:KaiC/GvpD/RAD55 family RecA-like ATPase
MATRLLHLPHHAQVDLLAEHLKGLIARNRSVLIVTTNLPAGTLFEQFQDHGVDINRVFVVDAVSSRSGVDVHGDPEHVLFVPGPQLLELIALRVEKIIRAKAQGPPHILILSANSFALYNSAEALEELVRYAVQRLVHPKIMIEFVLEESLPIPARLKGFLESFVDETLRLSAPDH